MWCQCLNVRLGVACWPGFLLFPLLACGKIAVVKLSCSLRGGFNLFPTVFRRRLHPSWTGLDKFLQLFHGISVSLSLCFTVQDQQVSAWMSSKGNCWSLTRSTSVLLSHVSSLRLFGGQSVDWSLVDVILWFFFFWLSVLSKFVKIVKWMFLQFHVKVQLAKSDIIGQ